MTFRRPFVVACLVVAAVVATLVKGDKVTLVVAPLKSGEPGGTMMRATLSDGTQMVMFGQTPAG